MAKTLDSYERLLLEIIVNAGEKLIDAATLHQTGYSYRSSWYLAIIAEEEMAKLVIIPFSKLAGTLKKIANRPSVAYSHPIKQKIFTTFGVQNRSYKEIESLKQSYLYVTPDAEKPKPRPVVTAKQSEQEILHAVLLFDRLVFINFSVSKSISDDFKSLLRAYYAKVFAPAIKDLSSVAAEMLVDKYANPPKDPTDFIEVVRTHPQLFAEMVQASIPERFSTYFKEIEGKSFHEVLPCLEKYVAE